MWTKRLTWVTTVVASDSSAQCRTPDSTLGTQIRKLENFQIFIRTVLRNFYPDGGSGSRYGQFLSGHGSGLAKTAIFTFFALKH
jgi:hypothetical protein